MLQRKTIATAAISSAQGTPQDWDRPFPFRDNTSPRIVLRPQGFPQLRDHPLSSGITLPPALPPAVHRPSPARGRSGFCPCSPPGPPRPLTAEPHRGRRRRGTGRCGTGRCGTARRGAGSAPAPPARRGSAAPAAAAPSPCGASGRRGPARNGGEQRPRGRDCRGACAGRGAGSLREERPQPRGGKRADGAG